MKKQDKLRIVHNINVVGITIIAVITLASFAVAIGVSLDNTEIGVFLRIILVLVISLFALAAIFSVMFLPDTLWISKRGKK